MAVIGIDEVGRGCWAGPLLVVAVRAQGALPTNLRDSKKLTKRKRETIAAILETTCNYGAGWVQPSEIDEIGLTAAMQLGVARALDELGAQTNEEIIMDGNFNYCSPKYLNVQCIIKADDSIAEVSAASIIAKVKRDTYMGEQGKIYPNYGFEKHVGYGTSIHAGALKLYGLTELHRKSFKPIQKIMNI